MAQAAAYTFVDGDVLTAAQLNTLNTNILNNGLAVVSPLTGDLEAGRKIVSDVCALGFFDTAADPEDTGYLVRNARQLRYYDGARVQTPQGLSDYTLTPVATSGTSSYEALALDAMLPADTLARSDWLLVLESHWFLAANGNQKLGQMEIQSGAVIETVSLFDTTIQGGVRSTVYFWTTGTNTQSYLGISVGQAYCNTEAPFQDSTLDEDGSLIFTYFGRSPTAAGDVSFQSSRLWIVR